MDRTRWAGAGPLAVVVLFASCGRTNSDSATPPTIPVVSTDPSAGPPTPKPTVLKKGVPPADPEDSNRPSGTATQAPSARPSSTANSASAVPPIATQGGKSQRPKSGEPELSLTEKDRTYVWDLEHHSNILVNHGFKALGRALATQDREAILAILATQFEGQIFDAPTEVGLHDAILSARRSWQTPTRQLDRVAMVTYLLEQRQAFRAEPKVRFDVKSISPQERDNLDSPWTAVCAMRMWGDAETEPGELSLVFQARFARPTKERMVAPEWLLGLAVQQVTNTRTSRFLFRDVTEKYGVDSSRLHDNWKAKEKKHNTGALYACDFNRDSCPDLLVTDGPHTLMLLRGRPAGGFDDVAEEVGLAAAAKMPVHCVHAAVVDLDGDGWEDVVFSRGDIWHNEQGERFVNVMAQSNFYQATGGGGPEVRGEFAAITVADYDRDGRMDLYLHRSSGTPNSWLEDVFDNPTRNMLLRNLGDWQFENVTAQSGVDGGGRVVFTSVWFDANNDLWPDLYVINEFGDGVLYVNRQDGTFGEQDVDKSTADFGSMGVTAGDIDNDGRIDLYVASMYSKAGSRIIGNMPPGLYPDDVMFKLRRLISGSEFYQNEGDLRFSAQGERYQLNSVGWAYGPTLADFNNDGLLDVFAPAGYISRDRDKPDG